MAADDGGGGCKTSSRGLRWPCLARCAVALVVGVLAAVILIKAVFLILHPNKFQLRVSGKFLVERTETSRDQYMWRFYLQAENRRDHVFMYYRNGTVKLSIDSGSPPKKMTIMDVELSPTVITLMQGEVQEYYFAVVSKPLVNKSYVDKTLSFSEAQSGQSIGGCTAEIDGILTNGGDTYRATYICETVTAERGSDIAGGHLPSASANDASRCIPTEFM